LDLYGVGFVEVMVITSAVALRDTLQGLQTIARGRSTTRGRSPGGPIGDVNMDFDITGSKRAAGESEDAVVQSTRNLVGDLTRNAGAKLSSSGGAAARGLDPRQSGIFSVMLQVVE
jgi:hypothetical protein